MKATYFDYAAATPVDKRVLAAMQPYWAEKFHNPSALYLAGRDTRLALTTARQSIARTLGAKPNKIIFTSGATEANNLAIRGVMNQYPSKQVVVGAIEHESVLAPASLFKHKILPVTNQGIIDAAAIKDVLPEAVLVSVMMVNNELGTLQPLRQITDIIRRERQRRLDIGDQTPIWLHSDASQAGNLFDLHISRLGIDLMSLNGGKIYGPKQSGTLYVDSRVELWPQIVGGGQEFGLRSGTENVALAVGLAKALELAQASRQVEFKRLKPLRQLFIELVSQKLPAATINGSIKNQSPHLLSISLPGTDSERLVMELDEAGIQTASGSACSASSRQPSHVLKAIGLSDVEAGSTLRFSFGRQTTASAVKQAVSTLCRLAVNR